MNSRILPKWKIEGDYIHISIKNGEWKVWEGISDFQEKPNIELCNSLNGNFSVLHVDDQNAIISAIKSKLKVKKKTPKNKKKSDSIIVPFLETSENFYELIYDGSMTYFIWMQNGIIKVSSQIQHNGITYNPACNEAIKKRAVILPSGAKEYESVEKLVEEIQKFIHKYVDVNEDFEKFCAYYILLSWVQDKLTTVPYLRLLGDFSTGKSRTLDVVGKLCYRAIIAAGTITPAPLFRLQGFFHGTLVIDEGDRKQSDETDEITKMLNCGFEKDKPVLRCNKDDPNDIEAFDPYGCKAIGSRKPFKDLALESRCLTEEMKETSRTDIPIILPQAFYYDQETLRKKLLMFRLKERDNIDANKIQEINLGKIHPRLKQAVSSFAVLFSNIPAIFELFKKFIQKYQVNLIESNENSFEGVIVNYLLDQETKVKENINGFSALKISSGNIADHLNNGKSDSNKITSGEIGKVLKTLGIKTAQKKIDGVNSRIIEWDPVLMDKLFQRYNADYWKKEFEAHTDTTDTIATTDTFVEKVAPVSMVAVVAEGPQNIDSKYVNKKNHSMIAELGCQIENFVRSNSENGFFVDGLIPIESILKEFSGKGFNIENIHDSVHNLKKIGYLTEVKSGFVRISKTVN